MGVPDTRPPLGTQFRHPSLDPGANSSWCQPPISVNPARTIQSPSGGPFAFRISAFISGSRTRCEWGLGKAQESPYPTSGRLVHVVVWAEGPKPILGPELGTGTRIDAWI